MDVPQLSRPFSLGYCQGFLPQSFIIDWMPMVDGLRSKWSGKQGAVTCMRKCLGIAMTLGRWSSFSFEDVAGAWINRMRLEVKRAERMSRSIRGGVGNSRGHDDFESLVLLLS